MPITNLSRSAYLGGGPLTNRMRWNAIEFMQADPGGAELTSNRAADAMVAAIEATGVQVSDFNKGNIKAWQRRRLPNMASRETAGIVVVKPTTRPNR